MPTKKQLRKEKANQQIDQLEASLYSGLLNSVVSFTVDDIAEASMETVHMIYYNPEAVLVARADYTALSDVTQHVLLCLIAGENTNIISRNNGSYSKNIRRYIKKVSRTSTVSKVFREAKGFISSLNSEQLDRIHEIII